MKKSFKFRNANISIKQVGYGQYAITGLKTSVRCTDSEIWDWCDDDTNKSKYDAARRAAYRMLKNNL